MTPYERGDEDAIGPDGIEPEEPTLLGDDDIISESIVEHGLEPEPSDIDWDAARRDSYWDATDAPGDDADGFDGGVIEIESGPSDQTTGE